MRWPGQWTDMEQRYARRIENWVASCLFSSDTVDLDRMLRQRRGRPPRLPAVLPRRRIERLQGVKEDGKDAGESG